MAMPEDDNTMNDLIKSVSALGASLDSLRKQQESYGDIIRRLSDKVESYQMFVIKMFNEKDTDYSRRFVLQREFDPDKFVTNRELENIRGQFKLAKWVFGVIAGLVSLFSVIGLAQ